MAVVSRRKMLGWTALAPLAGATAGLGGNTARAAITGANAKAEGGRTKSQLARERIQRKNLPNVPLLTHEGKPVMFYDDLIKGKIVTLNFFYTRCDEICPMVTAPVGVMEACWTCPSW